MQQNKEEFRRELRQIALSVAKAEKRPRVDEETQGEPAIPMGPPPLPPPPPLQQRATLTTSPLFVPFQARMGPDVCGPAVAGSGQIAIGSGGVGGDSVPAGTRPQFSQYEIREGSNRSVDARYVALWQYERFVRNGGRPFFGKLDAEEAFLWISSVVGVFRSMGCPMEHRVHMIRMAFQDQARVRWDSVQNSTFDSPKPTDLHSQLPNSNHSREANRTKVKAREVETNNHRDSSRGDRTRGGTWLQGKLDSRVVDDRHR